MALIEQYHVVADHFPVSPTATNIISGMFVMLDSNGNVTQATGGASTRAIGIAGDTKSTSLSGIPDTNTSWLGLSDTQQAFVNRVSDSFDETKASGRMTVYHSGGKFASDMYDATQTYVPGQALYVGTANAGDLDAVTGATGVLTNQASANSQIVATVVQVPGPYESGVPGVDINGSMTLGNYILFKLEL
jgi:hypothetical protein